MILISRISHQNLNSILKIRNGHDGDGGILCKECEDKENIYKSRYIQDTSYIKYKYIYQPVTL